MGKQPGENRRRFGAVGRIIIVLAIIGAALFGIWRYALATQAVWILDRADRIFASGADTRIAVNGTQYGKVAAQRIFVIAPAQATSAPRPVLVFIHGGSWNSGDPGDYQFIGRKFARHGFVVALPGYRLGREGAFPHMLEDSAAALAWVRDHIAESGGDPDRVFVMGHSAGAYNAVMLGLERQWLGRAGVPDGFVKGVIGLAGPYDFYPFTSESSKAAFGSAPDPALTQPIHFARADAPPMLLMTGDQDTSVKPRSSLALARALSAAGQPTQAVIITGTDHAGIVMKLAAPFDRDSRVEDAVLSFLTRQPVASAPVQAQAGVTR